MARFNLLPIKKLKKETKDAVSITFAIPDNLKKEFLFIAGQYITIKTTINNEEISRAYSICSSPNSDEITIAVKRIVGGNFSVYATTELKQETSFEITRPEGNFVLKTAKENTKNYLGFVAGSGITPVMSMIKSVLEVEVNSTFTLVFANKTKESTLFYEELNNLQKNHPSLDIYYVFSEEKTENNIFGRIDSSLVTSILEKNRFDDIFLCGPEDMISTIKDTLLQQNISEDIIHFELFTKTKDDSTIDNTVFDGETEITILLDDETTTFNMQQVDNILKAALAKDLDAPYSCQGGVCSSCLAKVTEGKVVMKNNSILSEDEIAEGYILTCEAHPTTSKLTIDYDM